MVADKHALMNQIYACMYVTFMRIFLGGAYSADDYILCTLLFTILNYVVVVVWI